MKKIPAQTQTKNGAARRSRAWTVGVAGILVAGAAAAFVPPVQQHVAAILDQSGMVGMRPVEATALEAVTLSRTALTFSGGSITLPSAPAMVTVENGCAP